MSDPYKLKKSLSGDLSYTKGSLKMDFNTNKEKILTYILFSYIGGFSLYAGISSNFALTYSLCPLITYFIGHYVFESLVMKSVVK